MLPDSRGLDTSAPESQKPEVELKSAVSRVMVKPQVDASVAEES